MAILFALMAQSTTLIEDSFGEPQALDRWVRLDGAVTGEGPSSVASLDGGALLLTGTADTRRWLMLQRSAPLDGASWIRVTARQKTDSVDPTGARYPNCYVFVRFGKGAVQPLRVLTGNTDWVRMTRRFQVPPGATEVTVACFLSMPGRAWFDDIRVESVPPAKWIEKKAGRYVYRWLPGDAVADSDIRYNQESYRLVSDFLGVQGPAQIIFFKYPDRLAIDEFTGFQGNKFNQGAEIHSVWADDRHEIVHILAREWGEPPSLLAEGLAVYLSGGWQNQPVSQYARKVLESNKAIPLVDLLETRAFRMRDDLVTYALAGAFTEWIIGTYGKEKLRALYRAVKHEASAEANKKEFKSILGIDLEEADRKLRESLLRTK